MLKKLFVFSIILFEFTSLQDISAQMKVHWTPDAEITRESFQGISPSPANAEIQQYGLSASWSYEIPAMGIGFAFKKNFNRYVEVSYIPELSWIDDGNLTNRLIKLAHLNFQMLEWHARIFRQKIFQSKGFGSSVGFYKDLFNEVNQTYSNYNAKLQADLNNPKDIDFVIFKYTKEVLENIELLADFCKTCKPKKK